MPIGTNIQRIAEITRQCTKKTKVSGRGRPAGSVNIRRGPPKTVNAIINMLKVAKHASVPELVKLAVAKAKTLSVHHQKQIACELFNSDDLFSK